ncbi:hypothetical protein PM082_017379 [Marasmius tenuissimus]|nr:hypothetical protein PM082_017379 [Marasmius tenuissimus]
MNDLNDPVSPSALPPRASPRLTRSRADSSAREEARGDPREHSHDLNDLNEFCLLVAGDHGGKSSFLRLLLETTPLCGAEHSGGQKQKAALTKFIQDCSDRTTCIRSTTVNVLVPQGATPKTSPKSSPKSDVLPLDANSSLDTQAQVQLALTLVDTPSIVPAPSPAVTEDVLRFVESRLAEAVDTSSRAGLMHLCIYFLDLSPSYPLPRHHIDTICRLSARVNVLPVIAKADTLSNQQLRAMKDVVRRDLADAGIGFGIFDQEVVSKPPDLGDQPNGKHIAEETFKIPGLPYALISPDSYDVSLSRSSSASPPPPIPSPPPIKRSPGNASSLPLYTRSFRWGSIDILDPKHSDFVSLKHAVFHHIKTLRNYTQQYLFERFKADFIAYRYPSYAQPQGREQPPPHSHHSREHRPHNSPPYTYPSQHSGYPPPPPSQQHHHSHSHSHSSSGSSRPVLAIDTGSSSASTPRHGPDLTVSASTSSRGASSRGGQHIPPVSDAASSGRASTKKETPDGPGEKEKSRPKKITVACNFCRSRKLKCDGVRPACVQCLKRSNPCDYQTQGRRRGAKGKRDKGGAAGEKDKDFNKEKAGKDGKSTNGNGSAAGSARDSRRSKASGSREDSEDFEGDGDEGSGTGSQDAEAEDDEDEDIDMNELRPSSRSSVIGRSRHGSVNEYPPAHLSHPPSSYRPPSSAYAQAHTTLPSISADFPPPPTHGRSRGASISSLTGPLDRERDPRDRGGYELPHIATLSLPDPTARHHQSSRRSPQRVPHGPPPGHHSRSSSSHHLPPPGGHLPPPHPQLTRSPPHHLPPPPHLPSPHHHLSASSGPPSHVSPHPSSSSGSASAHLSPHHHHRLPSPHIPPQQQQATSRKRAATAPSKSGGPVGAAGYHPNVPGPPRASEVSRGRSSTTSAGNPLPEAGGGPPVESLGVGGSAVNVGTIGSVTAGMIRATGRLPSTSGPKIVACNFCRARKTKCDGAHPSCGSCARRSLPCNYVHERGGRRGGAAAAAGSAGPGSSAQASTGAVTGSDRKPPSSSGRGSKRLSDHELEDPGAGGRKRMRVSE